MAALSSLAVGSSVYLNVDGTRTEFIIIQKLPPSGDYDNSCNGTWLLMKDIHVLKACDATNNSYADSDAHAYLNGEFISMLDPDIQAALTAVKIPYNQGAASSSTSENVMIGANGLETKAFLLSATEVGFVSNYTYVIGGVVSYFYNANNALRKAFYNGTAKGWFLRSPYIAGTSKTQNIIVNTSGQLGSAASTSKSHGYRPAMIFNDSFEVDANNNVTTGKKSFGGYVNIGGTYKELTGGYVNIGGTYKELTGSYKNIGGTWKE